MNAGGDRILVIHVLVKVQKCWMDCNDQCWKSVWSKPHYSSSVRFIEMHFPLINLNTLRLLIRAVKIILGGVCSLANYIVVYEETQSNRASDFGDFVCSLFPKSILFYFYCFT